MRRGVPADHARVGFVAAGAAAALAALAAVVERLRRDGAAASWRLPLPEGAQPAPAGQHMAHFRASAVAGTAEGGGVAALFAADGAQYAHMYEEAAMHWPPIRAAISAADAAPARVAAVPADAPPVSRVLYPRAHYPSEPAPEARPFSELHAQLATAAVGVGAFDVFKQAAIPPLYLPCTSPVPSLYLAPSMSSGRPRAELRRGAGARRAARALRGRRARRQHGARAHVPAGRRAGRPRGERARGGRRLPAAHR